MTFFQCYGSESESGLSEKKSDLQKEPGWFETLHFLQGIWFTFLEVNKKEFFF